MAPNNSPRRFTGLPLYLRIWLAVVGAVLVITLFFTAWVRCDASVVIAVVFTLCLLSLIASLLLFIRDINASLKALWLEMPPGLDRRD